MSYIESWIDQTLHESNHLSPEEKRHCIYSDEDIREFSQAFAKLNIYPSQDLQFDLEISDQEDQEEEDDEEEEEQEENPQSPTESESSSYVYAYGEIRLPEKGAFKDSLLKESNKTTLPVKKVLKNTFDVKSTNDFNLSYIKPSLEQLKLSPTYTHTPLPLSSKLRDIPVSKPPPIVPVPEILKEPLLNRAKDQEYLRYSDEEPFESLFNKGSSSDQEDMNSEPVEDINRLIAVISNDSMVTENSAVSKCALLLPESILKDINGEITYHQDIYSIEDKTWLPRHFQNHKLSLNNFIDSHRSFNYYKNGNCPKSSGRSDDPFTEYNKDDLKNFASYRYSRSFKALGALRCPELEVMCRLCRGKNWVKKRDFSTHLSLSHGVLSNPKCKTINLMPLPKSLIKTKNGRFIDIHVSCGGCGEWISLGNSATDSYNSRNRTLGFYANYFEHYIKEHKDILLNGPGDY